VRDEKKKKMRRRVERTVFLHIYSPWEAREREEAGAADESCGEPQ
jgi:hypothetical protein